MMEAPTVVEIAASDKQLQFLTSQARNVVLQGGARSGKTWAGVLRALMLLTECPSTWGMYVSPTYKQLHQGAMPHFQDLGAKLGIAQHWQWNRSEGHVTLPGGGTLLLRSAENPTAILGATLGWAVGDEVALWKRQAYDYLQDRLSDPRGPRQAYFTYTPKGLNWAAEVLGHQRKGLEIIRCSTADNPTLPADYHERLRDEHGEGSLYWRQEYEGEFVAWQGLVYPMFDAEKHLVSPPAEGEVQFVRTILAVDWGWTNPGCILVMGLSDDDTVYVLDEVYERERPLEWWVAEGQRLRDKWHTAATVCDPSEPGNVAAFAKAGLRAVGANNAVLPGITAVAGRFQAGRLLVTTNCPETRRELGVYSYKSRPDGTIRNDEPQKCDDHAMDPVRYGTLELTTRRGARLLGMA